MTQLIADRYALIDRYAVGGAADIFRARDTRTGDVVVVKRIREDIPFDPEVSGGFIREIQLSLLCQHPNVIRGLDSGSINGADYVVLEYVDGQDVEKLLLRARERKITIPLPFSLHIVREAARGLSAVHTLSDHNGMPLGLVHRDVTPRNIFVRYDGEVRLADLGASVATLQEPPPTELVGSAGYLSPEQVQLQELDPRADIFGLGCILYELVVGRPAFDVGKKSDSQIIKMHKRGQIGKIPSSVPESVRICIQNATAPDREDRFASAHEMQAVLTKDLIELGVDNATLGIASMLRNLFRDVYDKTRL